MIYIKRVTSTEKDFIAYHINLGRYQLDNFKQINEEINRVFSRLELKGYFIPKLKDIISK